MNQVKIVIYTSLTHSENANPAIGTQGKAEAVEEERIEVICEKEIARSVIDAVRAVHPYEEMAYEVYALLPI